ncbi:MAG: hypothetical protein P8M19_06515 [Crocinitomicaceae bacterium]|jgi:uncharacterized tellurite resistance protein B-like protein|nr:hypothetical protein [Crocinitomicaceae bacterium]MDG1659402.1 hypothetical protein [Crocinitomicaceae bacterium]MDG2441302.1 hypothetical protein [Crocinitomicaceae bacterium]|tara:strand:- start:3249 stop:3671 length:423 start_codon:yes stop_codon:yes gene_type:complete
MGTIAQLFESGQQSADKGHFRNLVMLARVDGRVDEAEAKLLARIATRLSLTNEQVIEIMGSPTSYAMIPPISKVQRYEQFVQFVEMICIDGNVDPSEDKLVHKYGVALGIDEEHIDGLYTTVLEKVISGESRGDIVDSIV